MNKRCSKAIVNTHEDFIIIILLAFQLTLSESRLISGFFPPTCKDNLKQKLDDQLSK